jgi:hypothetical protein
MLKMTAREHSPSDPQVQFVSATNNPAPAVEKIAMNLERNIERRDEQRCT